MKIMILALMSFAASGLAHMQLIYPPPLGGENNPYRTDAPNQYMQYPYGCCGQTDMRMCKGLLPLVGTPQGRSVASWSAGSTQGWNISGIGNHWGGSCQVGFSVDNGTTFQVATSYEGNCPHRNGGNGADGQNFNFTVPKDMPGGQAIFAWMWFNREQEFNMNCAVVNITGGAAQVDAPASGISTAASSSSSPSTLEAYPTPPPVGKGNGTSYQYDIDDYHCICTKPSTKRALSMHRRGAEKAVEGPPPVKVGKRAAAVAYTDRPGMFVADTKNGCMTPHTTAELKYPDPGPDVVEGDGVYPLELPSGTCGK